MNYSLLWKAYLEDTIVYACVNTITDAICGDGWKLKGGIKLHKDKVKKFFRDNSFDEVIRDVVLSLTIYGDAYMEVKRNSSGVIELLKPLDAKTMKIDYDHTGKVIKYIQRVLHRYHYFKPEDIIHFKANCVGSRVYGHSSLQALLLTLNAKLAAESYNADFFRRGAKPRIIYGIENLSKEQVDRLKANLQQIGPHQDVVLTGKVQVTTVDASNTDMQFRELLNYFRENIIAAMGVPPIFLGITEGSNRNTAQVQMESFDRKVRALRMSIADKINNQVLNTDNMGFDDVKFEFRDENNREELKDAQVVGILAPLVSQGIITPNELRARLKLPPLKEVIAEAETGIEEAVDAKEEINPMIGAPGAAGGNFNNPLNSAQRFSNPTRKPDRNEGRERQNAERQQENKSLEIEKDNRPANQNMFEYPYGAVPVDSKRTQADIRQEKKEVATQIDAVAQHPENNACSLVPDNFAPNDGKTTPRGVAKPKEVSEATIMNLTNHTEQLKHGNDPDESFDMEQLTAGILVELEHTDDRALAKQIAKAHLYEDPQYYVKLKAMEAKKSATFYEGTDQVAEENIVIQKSDEKE